MLRSLRITNLAIIEELSWDLEQGLTILTGETGAGKSILIDAISLVLGERADKSIIRSGAEQCSVEAVFDPLPQLKNILEQAGIENLEEELIVKRVITLHGHHRQFINASPTTLQILKKIGEELIDLHGPHDHQSLLSVQAQLEALDSFAQVGTDMKAYRELYQKQLEEKTELKRLQTTETGDWQKRLEWLQFQIDELIQADLKVEEESELEETHRVASHHQRILEIGQELQALLGDDSDLPDKLSTAYKLLEQWSAIDPSIRELAQNMSHCYEQIRETARQIEEKLEQDEWNTEQIALIETRLNQIQALKNKHSCINVATLLEWKVELEKERDELLNREERISTLALEIDLRQTRLQEIADILHSARVKKAEELADKVSQQLRELGFKQSGFSISIQVTEQIGPTGRDQIEMLFASNPGEPPRPLKAVASSGEMARIMLALKTVLAAQDKVPILIFDEIDANVGGQTAIVVGKKLRALSAKHQVLCITHLPQVAAAGHTHFKVQKEVQAGRTYVQLQMLGSETRIEEISRMLGSDPKTARTLAESLLFQVESKKHAKVR